MWSVAAGPFLAAAGLLVVAGFPKVADPVPLVRALRAAGLPAGRPVVRVFAVAEVAVGVGALVAPGRATAAAVAAAYLVFTGFVAHVLRRGGVLGSCGCFGKPDTPAALDPPSGLWAGADGAVVATAGLAVLIAFLAWQVMAVLPTTTPAAIRTMTKG